MSFQPESATYESGIYQIEKTDPVLGGLGGKTNLPLLQLANRTAWLKAAIDVLESGGGPFEYNASGGTLPVGGTDGPGVGGIKRKDVYYVTVPGTVSLVNLQIGDQLIAKVDDAATISDFIVTQSNLELATPTVIGTVKLVQNLAAGSQADATMSITGLMTLFAQLAGPVFTGAPKVPNPASNENSTIIASTKWVVDRIADLNTALTNALSSEATNRSNADTTLQNHIDIEATARGTGDTDEATARTNADNSLSTAISTEATTRSNADSAEATARAAADSNLNTIKADKSDANGWTNLAMSGGGVAGNNAPQWRINQFGEVEFRGNISGSVTTGSSSNTIIVLAIDLPVAIGNAINANARFVDKVCLISLSINVGSSVLAPCAAVMSLLQSFGKIWFVVGSPVTNFPAQVWNYNLSLEGLRAQLTG